MKLYGQALSYEVKFSLKISDNRLGYRTAFSVGGLASQGG